MPTGSPTDDLHVSVFAKKYITKPIMAIVKGCSPGILSHAIVKRGSGPDNPIVDNVLKKLKGSIGYA